METRSLPQLIPAGPNPFFEGSHLDRMALGLIPIILAGYLLFDRAFAWLHVPGVPLFIGELALAAALPLALAALRSRPTWQGTDTLFLLALYGGWGLLRALPTAFGNPVDTYRDSVIWIYCLFGLAVATLLLRYPTKISAWLRSYERLIPIIALWMPHTGLTDALESIPKVPDSPVSLLAHKPGNALVHVFIAGAFLWTVQETNSPRGRRRRNVLSAALVIGGILLPTQSRGGFVAEAWATALLLVLHRQRMRLAIGIATTILMASHLWWSSIPRSPREADPCLSANSRRISRAFSIKMQRVRLEATSNGALSTGAPPGTASTDRLL